MITTDPLYFCSRSATNLITNNRRSVIFLITNNIVHLISLTFKSYRQWQMDVVLRTYFKHSNYEEKSRGVCETLQYAPGGNKVEKAIFSFKVKVKVTRSLTLVSFGRASLVEYACQIWSLYLLHTHAKYEVSISNSSKVIAKVKVDNRQTNKQTGQKQYAPIIRSGGIKRCVVRAYCIPLTQNLSL